MSRGDKNEKPRLILLQSYNNTPLQHWNKRIRSGRVSQIIDQDLQSPVLEITSWKSSQTYITSPADPKKTLGIKAPYLHLRVKNLLKNFLFNVLVLDDRNVKRRFKASTKVKTALSKPYLCKVPLTLDSGWNEITIPLMEFTKKAYGTKFVEALIVQIHANCRIEKIFFTYTDTILYFIITRVFKKEGKTNNNNNNNNNSSHK
ncbi:orf protein, putative [Pediculus humanus corporis]|uniref:Orf protein, putative n=1 Tax=Pediculus humanus subsp. corporis TaxID=121224 RepID=E0VCB9_PEDHC|nr:orf protein, putative [Pediculus humanus corporis]EEB11005.1 orf protein, putative [Pediculus humanus corporis]